MQITELINQLNAQYKKWGDMPVTIAENDGSELYGSSTDAFCAHVILDETDNPKYLIVCDEDAADALS